MLQRNLEIYERHQEIVWSRSKENCGVNTASVSMTNGGSCSGGIREMPTKWKSLTTTEEV